jgi:MFS family permease
VSEAADARRVALLVGMLFGLAGLGSASAAIALPALAEGLGVSTGVSAWVVSLYALMLAVATAVYGRVSDLVGIRAPLVFGVSLMTVGAIAGCAGAVVRDPARRPRAAGSGAAAIPTLGIALISARYAGEVRAGALGRVAGVAAALSCVGPLAGGVVEEFSAGAP